MPHRPRTGGDARGGPAGRRGVPQARPEGPARPDAPRRRSPRRPSDKAKRDRDRGPDPQGLPRQRRGRARSRARRKQREAIGKPFELEFTDAIKGETVSIKGLKGKVVVIDFWATWCGPCVAEMPKMKKLYAEYKDKGVEFIGVSLDQPKEQGGLDKLKKFVAENEIAWPQYYQGNGWESEFSKSWGINSHPLRLHRRRRRQPLLDRGPRQARDADPRAARQAGQDVGRRRAVDWKDGRPARRRWPPGDPVPSNETTEGQTIMSQSLSLELSERAFQALRLRAEAVGTSPEALAASTLEGQFGGSRPATAEEAEAARERFERHFGELGPLGPADLDNEGIDADLAREYADNHEEA